MPKFTAASSLTSQTRSQESTRRETGVDRGRWTKTIKINTGLVDIKCLAN